MKKSIFYAILGALTVASCSKDLYEGSTEVEKKTTQEEINKYAENLFGVTFDPNHDWCTTTSGNVTFNVNPAEVEKIQLMVREDNGVDEFGLPLTTLKVVNEAEVNNRTSVRMYYNAPKDNLGMYAAFYSKSGFVLKAVDGNSVSAARATRTGDDLGYTLPEGVTLDITEEVASWANTEGNRPGEVLYGMSDATYQSLKMTRTDGYSEDFVTGFKAWRDEYLPNKQHNLEKVKASGCYNGSGYAETTGGKPIVVSPIYKQDGGAELGDEVLKSELYYYYYNKDVDMGGDPVAYIEKLPKYKAFPCNLSDLVETGLAKTCSFPLIFWGDEDEAQHHDKGTFIFPEGYMIGFMLRSNTDYHAPKHQGELYLDGRLNNYINLKADFSSAFKVNGKVDKELAKDAPQMAWLEYGDATNNVRHWLCCETGADGDLNDVIFEIEGGLKFPPITPPTEKVTYTYCFEDTPMGDYDMNDVVILAVRENETTVSYTIQACGAWDELYIHGINEDIEKKEVHELFGKTKGEQVFINTQSQNATPVTVTKTVAPSFDFLVEGYNISIVNATLDNYEVKLARVGEDPHGIMIPHKFLYPLEKVRVNKAYEEFNNWGKWPITHSKWYEHPVNGQVFSW